MKHTRYVIIASSSHYIINISCAVQNLQIFSEHGTFFSSSTRRGISSTASYLP